MNTGADNAETSRGRRTSMSDIGFTGNIVKVYKAVRTVDDTLGAKNDAVLFFIFQRLECRGDLLDRVAATRLGTEACKHLVSVMVVVMFVIVLVMMVVPAAAMLVVLVMVVVMLVLVFMLVLVPAAAMLIVLVMVVVMLVLVFMLVLVPTAAMLFVLVMMTTSGTDVCVFGKLLQLDLECILLFKHLEYLHARELFPRSCEYLCCMIVLPYLINAGDQLFIGYSRGMAENHRTCVFNLIVKELAEILHVHPALVHISNRGDDIEHDVVRADILDGTDNIAELTDSRRLDEYTVGRIVSEHLLQCFAKIPNEAAADTARIHLGDVHTRVLQKSTVNAYVAKLVFDKYQLFAAVGLSDELFDERSLSRPEKSRKYVDLRHICLLVLLILLLHQPQSYLILYIIWYEFVNSIPSFEVENPTKKHPGGWFSLHVIFAGRLRHVDYSVVTIETAVFGYTGEVAPSLP